MPSILGSSTIAGLTLSFTGPTGFTGPIGPAGPKGPPGLTLGPTGPTGFYIKDVLSDIQTNKISFILSDNRIIGPLSGFTGPSVNLNNSRGVSLAFSADYQTVLLGVCGGLTFEFRGICGDGQIVFPSLSSDGTELILSIGTITGGVSFGNTGSTVLLYSTPSGAVSGTKIKIIESSFHREETEPGFLTQIPADYLELGLTGPAGTITVPNVTVFSDFIETYIGVPSVTRNTQPVLPIDGISGVDSGGYVLNLDKSSVFKFATPLGITAFYRDPKYTTNRSADGLPDSTTVDSWVFFIDGADVWNLPSNLLFDSGVTGGLGGFGFCKGMNILRVQSDYHRGVYYASFIDRCVGDDTGSMQYGGIGSCCYSGGCEDYVTEDYCTDVKGGQFTALKTCKESCNIGSCCLNGVCRDNVSKEVCEHYLGTWDGTSACIDGDGSSCTAGSFVYQLTKINTTEPVSILNTASRSAPQKVAEFRVSTNDPTTKISIPSFISDGEGTPYGLFSFNGTAAGFGTDILGSEALITPGSPLIGRTFAIYFDNNSNTIIDKPYSPLSLRLSLKDSSNTEQKFLNFSVRPKFATSCGGDPDAVRIRTAFDLDRYCHDCWTRNDEGEKVYYPVQQQSGTFDYCYNKTTGTRTLICASSTEVSHVNDCSVTDAAFDPSVLTRCVHYDHGFTAQLRGMDCAPCLNALEDGCECGSNEACCCATCFKPEMNPASPNYGRCVFAPCPGQGCESFGLNAGDPFPDAEICTGGVFAGRDGRVERPTSETTTEFVCTGNPNVLYTNTDGSTTTGKPYWLEPTFYPSSEALKTQLLFAGITTEQGLSAEMGFIASQLTTLTNPDNGKSLYFTPENQNVNIKLTPALGLTCCNYEDYDTSEIPQLLIPVDWTPPSPSGGKEFEIKYLQFPGAAAHSVDMKCWSIKGPWYDLYGRPLKQDTNSCKQGCAVNFSTKMENLFVKCTFIKGTNPPQLSPEHPPCVIKPLKLDINCSRGGWLGYIGENSTQCGGGFYNSELIWPTDSGLVGISELLEANATVIGGQKFARITGFSNTCNSTAKWWQSDPNCYRNTNSACNIGRFIADLIPFGDIPTGPQGARQRTTKQYWTSKPVICQNLQPRSTTAPTGVGNNYKGSCSFQKIDNLTNASITFENSLLLQSYMNELIWKPRYCPCNAFNTRTNYCSTEPCEFLGLSCEPRTGTNLGLPSTTQLDNCERESLPGSKRYVLFVLQDPDNTNNFETIKPQLYEIDLVNNTTTLTDYWLYYSTGRVDASGFLTVSSSNPGDEIEPNLKKIRSNETFTISDLVNKPLGPLYVYWDGLAGQNDEFFSKTQPIQKVVKIDPTIYTNIAGDKIVWEEMPVTSPNIIPNVVDNGDTFTLNVTLDPVSTVVPLTEGEWSILTWAYSVWTVKKSTDAGVASPTTTTTGDDTGGIMLFDLNYDRNYEKTFGPWKYDHFPVDNFSNDTTVKLQITTTIIVGKDVTVGTDPVSGDPIGDGTDDIRVIENTQYITILRPGATPPSTGGSLPPRTTTRKLLTVDGGSRCVKIDCEAFGDCSTLPDC
jgi:hypothetical protein